MSLRAITVCVNYSDILALTLPYNRHHFDSFAVVTDRRDRKTAELAHQHGAGCYVTDLFYEDGASFNKWRALEWALDQYGRRGWLCLMDADVVWPKSAEPCRYMRKGLLLSPLRRICDPVPTEHEPNCPKCHGTGAVNTTTEENTRYRTFSPCDCRRVVVPPEDTWDRYPVHRNVREWAGYSQIFHAEDPHLGEPPWHQTDWKHAGGADSFFQEKWPADCKARPPWHCLHLGAPGVNWFGRSSPYLDGTIPENARDRHQAYLDIWPKRREERAAGRDPFESERLPKQQA